MFTIKSFSDTVYWMSELHKCTLGLNNGLSSDQLSDLGRMTPQSLSLHVQNRTNNTYLGLWKLNE